MYYSIDRFEGSFAVCENRETREMINIPKTQLSEEAKEGDIIKLEGKRYIVDYEKTEEVRNRIKNLFQTSKEKWPLDTSKLYVIADFSKTITKSSCKSLWSILAGTDLLPEQYKEDRQELYDIYRPIEVDDTIEREVKSEKLKEWYKKHLELFVKYQLQENAIEEAIRDNSILEFRDGAKEFLQFLNRNNIPIIFISAGIGNFIEEALKKESCLLENTYIISNFIEFENGVAISTNDKMIHAFNKNEAELSNDIKKEIKDREQILILGDQIEDLLVVDEVKREEAVKVGFLKEKDKQDIEKFENNFDIVCTDNDTYEKLQNILFA